MYLGLQYAGAQWLQHQLTSAAAVRSAQMLCLPCRQGLPAAQRLAAASCQPSNVSHVCCVHCFLHWRSCRDMIDGMRMDLVKSRYETYDELYEYCYRVAGTVALMSMPVMGVDPAYKVGR